MLKLYIKSTETLKNLRADKDGVVSFEYVIVAAAIVGAVVAAFGTTAGVGPIKDALSAAITAIAGKIS